MKIAVTGNRKGLTAKSRQVIEEFLSQHQIKQIHHGDCIGLDTDMHALAHELNLKVVIHPPSSAKFRSGCKAKGEDEIRLQEQFLKRNQSMVKQSDMLIGFPPTKNEILRSGTWSTIRYARKSNKPILIIFGDGSQRKEQQGRWVAQEDKKNIRTKNK